MARRHGWQLPAHSFQVLATTVFFLLSIAFYAFFAPFLGKKSYELVAVTVHSIFAFSVIILYIRCASIDPADSGVLIAGNGASACKSQRGRGPGDPKEANLNPETRKKKEITCTDIGCFFCRFMAKEDCHRNLDTIQQQPSNDEGVFCTLCNAVVGKLSKHCRSCDKCVDGFDHHCRWLNNCIGRKNYTTFVFLMAASLAWATVQCGVGIAVLVRRFVNKLAIQNEVIDRLGDAFSMVSLTIIVAICTALTLIAMAPLGELFFFHMILIRKGITTYDYVVAMRAQSDPPVNEQSLSSSPFSSAPAAISGGSLGLQNKGAWCTPPRITATDWDEIMPHSNVNPEPSESSKRATKPPVRISAWKLAKLDLNEAMRAAAKAPATLSCPTAKEAHQNPTTNHFNPIFQSSTNRSDWPTITGDGEDGMLSSGGLSPAAAIARSSVRWDQVAGRFVSSPNAVGSSLMAGNHAEFLYSRRSIFFWGPRSNERTRVSRNDNDLLNRQQQQRVGIGRGSSQFAVAVLPRNSSQ